MATILFDAMSLDGRPSGTRTRVVRLVPELVRRGHAVTVLHGRELDADARATMGLASLVEVSPAPGPGPLRRLALQAAVYRRQQQSLEPEWVSAETWPMPRVTGLLPVIHDLRYLSLGKGFVTVFEHFVRDACARAARIHTDSAVVAGQVAARFSIDRDRIDVVPIGVLTPDLATLREAVPPVDGPYVVVVGHDEPRKDLALVREVSAGLTRQGITLIRVGRRPGERVSRGYRAGRVKETGRRGEREESPGRHLGIVSDEVRDVLYHHAIAVLVASREEGYGLVPLEGLAAGAWVVASDIPAHREILGDGASFFTPGDSREAYTCLLQASRASPGERQERIVAGRSQALRFTPARSADAFEASLSAARQP